MPARPARPARSHFSPGLVALSEGASKGEQTSTRKEPSQPYVHVARNALRTPYQMRLRYPAPDEQAEEPKARTARRAA